MANRERYNLKKSSSYSRFYINDGVNITNDKKIIAEKF